MYMYVYVYMHMYMCVYIYICIATIGSTFENMYRCGLQRGFVTAFASKISPRNSLPDPRLNLS